MLGVCKVNAGSQSSRAHQCFRGPERVRMLLVEELIKLRKHCLDGTLDNRICCETWMLYGKRGLVLGGGASTMAPLHNQPTKFGPSSGRKNAFMQVVQFVDAASGDPLHTNTARSTKQGSLLLGGQFLLDRTLEVGRDLTTVHYGGVPDHCR